MALSNPLESFIWGEGGAKLSPEQIAQRRKVEEALLARGVDTSPVGHWTQGLARVANAMGGAVRRGRLDRAEDANNEYQTDLGSRLIGGVGGSSSPVASAATSGIAGELAATSPAPSSGGPSTYRDAIASIESAGSGDYAAIGPTNAKLGRPLGRYQVMEANIGPWSMEALGRQVTPDEFLASPEIQDAIFDHKFGSYVTQYGPEGAAQAWFAGPGGVGKTGRKDVLGTSVGDYGKRFTQATGGQQVAAATPEAAIEAIAPSSGMIAPPAQETPPAFDMGRFGDQMSLAEMPPNAAQLPGSLIEQGANMPTAVRGDRLPASPLPDPVTVGALPAMPVQETQMQPSDVPQLPEQFTANSPQLAAADPRQGILRALMGIPGREAGATGAFPPAPSPAQPGQPAAPQRAAMNPAIMEALTDPRASEQQRRIAGILLEQQMQKNDPLRQAQIAKLQRELTMPVKRDTTTINGRLVDAQTGEEIANFEDPNAKAPTVQKLKLDDGSEMAVQWNSQTGKWDPIDAPMGGGGIAPKTKLTESQSKLVLFQSLQTETQPVLLDLEAQFNPANISDAAARSTPIAGNFFQSEKGQIYNAAATAWAEGALRIATGAAATPEEMERTKKAYFAQPGDTPNTIAFKAQMREMYNRSIDRSLGNQNTGKLPNPSDFAKKFDEEEAVPEGIDPSDWEFMTPEERRLFQ